jgi:hypothetical protein
MVKNRWLRRRVVPVIVVLRLAMLLMVKSPSAVDRVCTAVRGAHLGENVFLATMSLQLRHLRNNFVLTGQKRTSFFHVFLYFSLKLQS